MGISLAWSGTDTRLRAIFFVACRLNRKLLVLAFKPFVGLLVFASRESLTDDFWEGVLPDVSGYRE